MTRAMIPLAMAVVMTLAIGLAIYHRRMRIDRVVHLVIPDGYRKIFRLVVDSAAEQPTRGNGAWIYRIPEGGVLRVRDRKLFLEWHRTTAAYQSGKPLEVAPLPPMAPYSDEIRIHSAGAAVLPDGSQTVEFFVGADHEMLENIKQFEHPLGGVSK